MEKQATIFLIDDEEEAIKLLEMILRREGYKTMAALSGQEALQIIEEESQRVGRWQPARFDLVLLDIMMPGIDGFKICQRIKTDELLWHIPVIMTTVLKDTKSKITALSFGADDHVTKPFIPPELLTAIRARLETKHRVQELMLCNAELAAFNAIFTAAAHSLNPGQVLQKALAEILKAMEAYGGAVFLIDEAGRPQPVAWKGLEKGEELPSFTQPILSEDISQDPAFAEKMPKEVKWRSFLSVPLRTTEKIVGNLSICDSEPGRFTRRDLEWLTSVADQVSIAYENALLFNNLQSLLAQSSTFRKDWP